MILANVIGGPYDGAKISPDQVNSFALNLLEPVPSEAGPKSIIFLPPLSAWDDLNAGNVTRESVLHAQPKLGWWSVYEIVRSESRVDLIYCPEHEQLLGKPRDAA